MEIIKLSENPKVDLKENQYYSAEFPKKFIFLHHTVSTTVESAIEWWNKEPDHVATPYIIDRNGQIYETFDPKYWAYALGLKGGTNIERASIHIELVSMGPIIYKTDYRTVIGNHRMPESEVVRFPGKFRGYEYFHRYTDQQLESLSWLLKTLMERFNIKKQPNTSEFWQFRDWKNLNSGIWSHTTVRSDKSDIVPQKELIEMIYQL